MQRNNGWRSPRKQLDYPAGGWSQMFRQGVKSECRCQKMEADICVLNGGKSIVPGSPVVKTSPFLAQGVDSVPGLGAKTPCAS